jgi:hypothetical protein
VAASADAFALVMLGHPNVKLYDASLGEWAIDPTLPMETGLILSRRPETNSAAIPLQFLCYFPCNSSANSAALGAGEIAFKTLINQQTLGWQRRFSGAVRRFFPC